MNLSSSFEITVYADPKTAAKSDNYRFCSSKVNAADIWRGRVCALIGEVLQAVSLAVVTMNCEKSAEAIVAKEFL